MLPSRSKWRNMNAAGFRLDLFVQLSNQCFASEIYWILFGRWKWHHLYYRCRTEPTPGQAQFRKGAAWSKDQVDPLFSHLLGPWDDNNQGGFFFCRSLSSEWHNVLLQEKEELSHLATIHKCNVSAPFFLSNLPNMVGVGHVFAQPDSKVTG